MSDSDSRWDRDLQRFFAGDSERARRICAFEASLPKQTLLAEAQQAKQRLQGVLRTISDCFIALDRDWRYVTVNDRACEGLGKNQDQILAQCIWDIHPDRIGTRFETELRRAAAEQTTAVFEHYDPADKRWYENRVHPSPDGVTLFYTDITGRVIDTTISVGCVRAADGSVESFLALLQDVTERKRAEQALRESEERFRGMFDSAAVGIALEDFEGRFLRVNQKYCDIVGYTREELLGRSFVDITSPEELPVGLDRFKRLARGEVQNYALEKRYVRKDGSLIWTNLAVSLQRDPSGLPAYAIAVLQDISDRKRLEAALRRAKEAAEAANRSKDEFLANVSHEIRTPFGAILGMTELVLDTALSDDQRQCLEVAKSAADGLLGIVNDLLDFEKIEAGKLELEAGAFSLREAVGHTVDTLARSVRDKGLELTWHVAPEVPDALEGDSGRLRQVLLNLIGNAIKFTERGAVTVSVEEIGTRGTRDTAYLRFSVRDTGIGIPRDQQSRVFRAFEQADPSITRKFGGTGLGLSIAAQLVALVGGNLTVDSEPGRGSTFAFTARLKRQPGDRPISPAQATPAQPSALAAPLRILVAEDNEWNVRHLERLLSRRGYIVRVARDGREALAIVGDAPTDALLLDMHMPEFDGFEVARAIRERERGMGKRLPIVALTARARKEDREACLAAGVDEFLSKPVRAAELFAAIDRVVAAEERERPGPRPPGERSSLIDRAALWAACAEDAEMVQEMCRDLQTFAPRRLVAVMEALRDGDGPRLRDAAHKLCGLISAFSVAGGNKASELEDAAAAGKLEGLGPLAQGLEAMTQELLREAGSLSFEPLRNGAARAVVSANQQLPTRYVRP